MAISLINLHNKELESKLQKQRELKPAVPTASPPTGMSALQQMMAKQRAATPSIPTTIQPKKEEPALDGESETEAEEDASIVEDLGNPGDSEDAEVGASEEAVRQESTELVKTIDASPEISEDFLGSFQERLNHLDTLIQADLKISAFSFDLVKSHVRQIMIDLKEQPELDSCLIDRDVHNILRFIRSVKDTALETHVVKKTKKEAKAKKGGVGDFKIDLMSLPMNLKALGNLKT